MVHRFLGRGGAQGVFRGLGDTRAPLYATLWVNAANILLCPALIFWAGLGVRGAAIATVASEVAPRRCPPLAPSPGDESVSQRLLRPAVPT